MCARRFRFLTVLFPLVLGAALLGSTGVQAAARGSSQYAQAQQQARAGHYTVAVHDYEQAILQGRNDPYTYWQLGLAYGKVKRWDDAVWAISTALSDGNFAAQYPQAAHDLEAVSGAGGASGSAPAALRGATMSPAPTFHPSAAQLALEESKAAFTTLQDEAFFVAPEWNRQVSAATSVVLSNAARSLNESANTTAKFAFLGATPVPYTDLGTYAKDLFSHLNLQRAVLVVVTPQHVSAYSDRLSEASVQRIVDKQRASLSLRNPAALAASVARAVTARADENDSTSSHWSLAIGSSVIALILAVVAIAIVHIMRSDGRSSTRGTARHARAASAR